MFNSTPRQRGTFSSTIFKNVEKFVALFAVDSLTRQYRHRRRFAHKILWEELQLVREICFVQLAQFFFFVLFLSLMYMLVLTAASAYGVWVNMLSYMCESNRLLVFFLYERIG